MKTRIAVRTTLAIQAIATLAAVAALVISLVTFNDRLDTIQKARIASATDDCRILDTVIIDAFGSHRIEAQSLIGHVGLRDCQAFGRRVR